MKGGILLQTFFSNRIYKRDLEPEVVERIEKLMQEYASLLHSSYKDVVTEARNKANGKNAEDKTLYFKMKEKFEDCITYFRNTAIRDAKGLHSKRMKSLRQEIGNTVTRLSNTKRKLLNTEKRRNSLLKYKEMIKNGNLVFDNKQRTFKKEEDKIKVYRGTGKRRKCTEVFENEYLFECYLQTQIRSLKSKMGLLTFKINKLENKLKYLNNKYIPAVQFGTKRLRKQGLTDEAKQQEYLRKRSNRFSVSGRQDSINGNFVFSYDAVGKTVNIYLSKTDSIKIPAVVFPYGQKQIEEYYKRQRRFHSLCKLKDCNEEIKLRPITYSIEDKGKYYIIKCGLEGVFPEKNYSKAGGVIGIDCNLGFYSACETTEDGSLKLSGNYSYKWKRQKKTKIKYNIEQQAKEIVELAVSTKKPLVIEKLKFSPYGKMSDYNSSKSKNFNRNSFAFDKMTEALKARAQKKGVEVFEVSPVYTSFIAKEKFSPYYKRSIHEMAALAIARRCLFPLRKERIPKSKQTSSWKKLYALSKKKKK